MVLLTICHVTVTQEPKTKRYRQRFGLKVPSRTHCNWCSVDIGQKPYGRKRRYCSHACRQRAYEYRKVERVHDWLDWTERRHLVPRGQRPPKQPWGFRPRRRVAPAPHPRRDEGFLDVSCEVGHAGIRVT